MAALLPITGTVSVSLMGCEAIGLGTFSIPADATLDPQTGITTLEATPNAKIITAMAEALREAADQILATIPDATVETFTTAGPFLYCPTCTAGLEDGDDSMTISHGPNGQHIADQRY